MFASNQSKTEKCYSFLLAIKHYIKTAANGSRDDTNFEIHYRKRIVRKVITALENNDQRIQCQRSTYEKAYKKFPKHGTIMSQILLFATVLSKLESLTENSASKEDENNIPLGELKKIVDTVKENRIN
ncbi:hypothetical protein AVEN_206106-1 [Araneus ventricosus]|uniref:Uncharacterized protein n=1 Tax=Araneus ventricosus TaxID=182803 RepID=A0A4Y2QYE0_ARAVE|nr:hypothetical protein AVEN_206106-1 [Araneus ventricosus]